MFRKGKWKRNKTEYSYPSNNNNNDQFPFHMCLLEKTEKNIYVPHAFHDNVFPNFCFIIFSNEVWSQISTQNKMQKNELLECFVTNFHIISDLPLLGENRVKYWWKFFIRVVLASRFDSDVCMCSVNHRWCTWNLFETHFSNEITQMIRRRRWRLES